VVDGLGSVVCSGLVGACRAGGGADIVSSSPRRRVIVPGVSMVSGVGTGAGGAGSGTSTAWTGGRGTSTAPPGAAGGVSAPLCGASAGIAAADASSGEAFAEGNNCPNCIGDAMRT
jgi:hypothetical protein